MIKTKRCFWGVPFLLIMVFILLSACGSGQTNSEPEQLNEKGNDVPKQSKTTSSASVSVATAYMKVGQIKKASDLIIVGKIKGVDHVNKSIPPKIGSTFFKVKVLDVLKTALKSENIQQIIVRQVGRKNSKVNISLGENHLFKKGEINVLFLKRATNERFYYISGTYQGRFKVNHHKVYSMPALNQMIMGFKKHHEATSLSKSNSLIAKGIPLSQFKKKIEKAN